MWYAVDITNHRFGRLVASHRTSNNKYNKAVWVCECDCGNMCTVTLSNLTNDYTQSCGCLRRDNARSTCKNRVGTKNPGWNPDKISRKDFGHQHKQLSLRCFERDNFSCVICGNNRSIEAHHLYNFADYPNKRFDVENVVTLCKQHHKEFHHMYGRKNNTPQQFYEFAGVI